MKSNKPSIKDNLKPLLQRFIKLWLQIAVVMVFFMMTRILFYFYNYNYFPDTSTSYYLTILRGGLRFDFSAVMFLNILYIVLFLLPFGFTNKKIWRKSMLILFVVINSIGLLANVMDTYYFDFILKRSTANVFMFATENNILRLLVDFLIDFWSGFLIGFLVVILLIIAYKKSDFKEIPIRKNLTTISVGFFIWAFSIGLSILGMRSSIVNKTFPISIGDAARYVKRPADMALILNTPFSIIKTVERTNLEPKNYFTQNQLDSLYNPIYKPAKTGKFKPDNVVIILLESFGQEFVGYFNPNMSAEKSNTPFLDSLAGKSYCFMRAFANGRKSISALPAICAGIPYAKQSFVRSPYVYNKIKGLGEMLSEKGYNTSFFHGANNGSLGLGGFMNSAGYDRYFGKDEYGNNSDYDGSWGIRDVPFFNYFADKLNEFPEPFHSVIFSLSSHHPYSLPEQYADSFPNVKEPQTRAYRYSDNALRAFFQKAKKSKWYKNTLFVITADHTARSVKKTLQTSITNYSIPILFFHPSDSTLVGKDSTVIEQLDITPTIASYLNYDKEFLTFGENAFSKSDDGEAFINMDNLWQYISGDYVVILKNDGVFALYNYKKDPELSDNLIDKLPKIKERFETRLKAFIQRYTYRMLENKLVLDETS